MLFSDSCDAITTELGRTSDFEMIRSLFCEPQRFEGYFAARHTRRTYACRLDISSRRGDKGHGKSFKCFLSAQTLFEPILRPSCSRDTCNKRPKAPSQTLRKRWPTNDSDAGPPSRDRKELRCHRSPRRKMHSSCIRTVPPALEGPHRRAKRTKMPATSRRRRWTCTLFTRNSGIVVDGAWFQSNWVQREEKKHSAFGADRRAATGSRNTRVSLFRSSGSDSQRRWGFPPTQCMYVITGSMDLCLLRSWLGQMH